jgi:hypothetical protein
LQKTLLCPGRVFCSWHFTFSKTKRPLPPRGGHTWSSFCPSVLYFVLPRTDPAFGVHHTVHTFGGRSETQCRRKVTHPDFVPRTQSEERALPPVAGPAFSRNYLRKKRHRDNKSPVEISKQRFPQINEGGLNLPSIRL